MTIDVICPPLAADLLDDHPRDGIGQVGVFPPYRRRECRLPIGVEVTELVGRRKLIRGPMVSGLALVFLIGTGVKW